MSNSINQHKKRTRSPLFATKKIIFLFAILFGVGLTTGHAQNIWTRKADFGGTARGSAVGFSIGSKGYIGTGYDGSYRKDFWEYDPATNTWTQKADFGGTGRHEAVGFSIGTKGYLGTGQFYDGGTQNFCKDFWEYDPAANTWTRKVDFGGTARTYAAGLSIGSKGYIGKGYDGSSRRRDFWEYDPATNTWTQKADFKGTTSVGGAGFSIGSKGYWGTGTESDNYYKDFWEYDPATNAWTQKADFGGTGRYSAVGFSIGNKGYLGTGESVDKDENFEIYYKDFWEYDAGTNIWMRKADFGGTVRTFAVGFSIGSKGYLGIGGGQGIPKDFWEYTPSCLAPVSLRVPKISDTSAVVRWNISGTGILYVQLRYRAVGETAWKRKKRDATKSFLFIGNLDPNTTYQWQLRSLCAEDTTGWVQGPNFKTASSSGSVSKATVYPNPARSTVSINYTAQKNGKYIFEITGISGNVLLRKEANAMLGANRITLDVNRLIKGVYFISIIKPDKTRERMQVTKE